MISRAMFCACLAGASLFALATAASASTITPTSNFFPYAGSGSGTAGDGVVAVSAPSSTAWTAVSNASWLSIVTGTGGTGNGSVTFSVAANSTDAQRVGTLTIAGQAFTVTQLGPPPATGSVQIVEYHNSAQDDYFITADPAEQQALDAAALVGAVWSRTGMTFNSGGDASVYRFIYKSPSGVNTHFYTVNTNEQSSLLANYPIWALESPIAFYMKAANPNQTCPAGYVPVYRAAQEQTGSHRFTTQQSAISEVLTRGWTNEGVAFCAPQGSGGVLSSPQNVTPIIVDGGPQNTFFNLASISVTICSPGSTTNCQTIDHIQVDTGSSGLRIISTVLNPSLSLPRQTDASGDALVECLQFVSSYVWGPVKLADVKVAGEQASSIPIQIIGESEFPTIPSSCSSSGTPTNTVQTFGANGIIGISPAAYDCGSFCASSTAAGQYYICPATGCVPTFASLAQQPPNPVAMFSTDNNGALVQLPSIPLTGAATASGSLIFGIGTQANNALGSATVVGVNPNTLNFTTIYKNQSLPNSYLDTGTPVLAFNDSSIPTCDSGFDCPSTTLSLTAVNRGTNGTAVSANFSVANEHSLNGNFDAFSDIAATNNSSVGFPSSFAWGLPFFFGRNVFTAIENRATPGGTGPYFAY